MATPLDILEEKKEKAMKAIEAKGFSSKKRVYVGLATCEIAAGSREVMEVFSKAADEGRADIYLSAKGCAGRCNLEPTVEVVEEGRQIELYTKVTPEMAEKIVERISNG